MQWEPVIRVVCRVELEEAVVKAAVHGYPQRRLRHFCFMIIWYELAQGFHNNSGTSVTMFTAATFILESLVHLCVDNVVMLATCMWHRDTTHWA